MGLGGAVQAQQLGQIGTGVQVTLGSLADEVSLTAKGHHVYLAEWLPLVRAVSSTSTAGTPHSRSASRMATLVWA